MVFSKALFSSVERIVREQAEMGPSLNAKKTVEE